MRALDRCPRCLHTPRPLCLQRPRPPLADGSILEGTCAAQASSTAPPSKGAIHFGAFVYAVITRCRRGNTPLIALPTRKSVRTRRIFPLESGVGDANGEIDY